MPRATCVSRAALCGLLPIPLLLLTGIDSCQDADADGDGWTLEAGDCDDHDAEVHPEALEVCDGKDNNCDAQIDEGVLLTVYPDLDRDAFGSDDGLVEACTLPEDYVAAGGDCDDTNPDVHPGALEICNDLDDDCDGLLNEETPCADVDDDGYTVADGDCDDYAYYTHPGAIERPDAQDNDCDGQLEGTLTGASAQVQLYGDLNSGMIGTSISGMNRNFSSGGDVNGDGHGDLVIGSASYDAVYQGQYRGAAFLLFGRDGGWSSLEGAQLIDQTTLLYGEEGGARAGSAVAMAGDLNGDGLADFAVGAPTHSVTGSPDVGEAFIIFGRSSGWGMSTLTAMSYATLEGIPTEATSYSRVGQALAGGGDVNGDGFDDLVVGAPWSEQTGSYGWAMVVPGKDAGWSAQIRPSEISKIYGYDDMVLGWSATIAGHVNGDGMEDLVIGALHDPDNAPGSVVALLGDSSYIADSVHNLEQLNANEYYGSYPQSYVGDTVSGRVDVNGDGFDDILVGREDAQSSYNFAYVLFGGDTLPTSYSIDYRARLVFTPYSGANDECPCVVQGIGDMNGDGRGDFAIGLPQNDDNGDDAGKVYIFHGRDSSAAWGVTSTQTVPTQVPLEEADMVILGEKPGDQFGSALGAGDVNSDGWQDLAVSAPGWDGTGNDVGKLYVFFGYPPGHNPAP